jgi:hypothetical protein
MQQRPHLNLVKTSLSQHAGDEQKIGAQHESPHAPLDQVCGIARNRTCFKRATAF